MLFRPGEEPTAVPPIELSADPGLISRFFGHRAGSGDPGRR